jgi:hypothetical protein
MMDPRNLLVAVVGNCASGKTTLVGNLHRLGYRAVNVPQEHSDIRRLWRYKEPDLLVLLSCTYATAKKRRPNFAWSEKQLAVQRQRLALAREECDLYIVTDDLSREEVTAMVTELIEKQARGSID